MTRPDAENRPNHPAAMRAAMLYLSYGWSVIALRPGDKRPVIPWQEYQHRHPSEREVASWFALWPQANIGIVTGAVSRLVVLDVDPAHGGNKSLAGMESLHGPLPSTVQAVTGGGGRHFYFVHPGGTVPNRVGLLEGIDLRGDGGYVVAPPSLHPSGGRYAWVAEMDPEKRRLADLPSWLRIMVRLPRLSGHGTDYWRHLVHAGVSEGQRNNTIASLAGHLLWHGVDPLIVLELLLSWNRTRCRPPLPDAEVARTVESITRLHEAGRG